MHGILSFKESVAEIAEKFVAVGVWANVPVLKVFVQTFEHIGSIVILESDETVNIAYYTYACKHITYRPEKKNTRHRTHGEHSASRTDKVDLLLLCLHLFAPCDEIIPDMLEMSDVEAFGA